MNDKLSCDIVRDLLPSYADGLTCAVTNAAVDEHLQGCAPCSEVLRRMREPENADTGAAAEVDYLKKLRRRSRVTSLLVGIMLMLLGMTILGYRYFYVGSRAGGDDALYRVSVSGDTLTLGIDLTSSGLGVSRVVFSDSNGMVEARVYTAPKAFFNSGEYSASYTAPCSITQVRVGDIILWEEGISIDSSTARIFAAINPYVGDMPSNARIADQLGILNQLGPYTNELQTETEPYGWTLILETPVDEAKESAAKELMEADSCIMLAAIENLGYVTWRYESGGQTMEYTVTAQDASDLAGKDIKSSAASASQLQKLMQSLYPKWSALSQARSVSRTN